jgi:hypothetical protein
MLEGVSIGLTRMMAPAPPPLPGLDGPPGSPPPLGAPPPSTATPAPVVAMEEGGGGVGPGAIIKGFSSWFSSDKPKAAAAAPSSYDLEGDKFAPPAMPKELEGDLGNGKGGF